jgi:hypothetical protein
LTKTVTALLTLIVRNPVQHVALLTWNFPRYSNSLNKSVILLVPQSEDFCGTGLEIARRDKSRAAVVD